MLNALLKNLLIFLKNSTSNIMFLKVNAILKNKKLFLKFPLKINIF